MRTPFSQTFFGAIVVGVIVGVVVLLLQSNFFGPQTPKLPNDPVPDAQGSVLYQPPGWPSPNKAIQPEIKYEVACDTLYSPDACTYYSYCKWNPAGYRLNPGDENLGHCTQKQGW